MSTPKTTPKKLRNGPVILVDTQVIRWRQRMAREGLKLGKGMKYAEKQAETMRKRREVDSDEKLRKKKFF